MLTFLKEKEREYETPFTNTSCNASTTGDTIKEVPILG